MARPFLCLALILASAAAQHVVPGKVKPTFPHTYDMARSSGMMTCNASGPVDPIVAAKWGLIDLGALLEPAPQALQYSSTAASHPSRGCVSSRVPRASRES
jgi:hypothetical protein